MLELLASALLVRICHLLIVDLRHVGESVHDEGSHQSCLTHFVCFNIQVLQGLQGLQLGNLDETVNIIVLKEQCLQFSKLPHFPNTVWRNNGVKAHILERNLLNCLLKVCVVQYFERIAVNKKLVVALDFGVARLHKALSSGLLSALEAVQA